MYNCISIHSSAVNHIVNFITTSITSFEAAGYNLPRSPVEFGHLDVTWGDVHQKVLMLYPICGVWFFQHALGGKGMDYLESDRITSNLDLIFSHASCVD